MYPSEVKKEALKLISKGQKVSDVASVTSISKSTLYNWVKVKNETIRRNQEIAKRIAQINYLYKYTNTRDYNEIEALEAYIGETHDYNPNPLTLLHGITLAKIKKDIPKVVALAKQILVIDPENVNAKNELITYKNKQNNEKKRVIKSLIERYYEEKDINFEKAREYLIHALSLIEEGIVISPDDFTLYIYGKKIAILLDNIPEAIRFLKKQMSINSNNENLIEELIFLQQQLLVKEKARFINRYHELKERLLLEEQEIFLTELVERYPEETSFKIELADVLISRAYRNPLNIQLLAYIKKKLLEFIQENVITKTYLHRLEMICNPCNSARVYLKEKIARDNKNNKAKYDLTKLYIEKYKIDSSDQNYYLLDEGWQLMQDIILDDPDNSKALGLLTAIAALKRQFSVMEQLLRKRLERKGLELSPHTAVLQNRLAGTLLELATEKKIKNNFIDKDDPLIIEAENILLLRHNLDPQDIYTISYLINAQILKGNLEEALRLSNIKRDLNPTDLETAASIKDLEEAILNLNISSEPQNKPMKL